MTFPTDDIFLGPPAYGLRKGTEGIVFHTTEGAGTSRAAAAATAQWQASSGFSSYNFILYDAPLGALLTVPYLEASGSLTLKRTNPPWNPGRYPWLAEMLSPAAYADPNAYLVAISLSGKKANFLANGYPPNMIDTAARLVKWIEDEPWGNDSLVLCNHFNWQTDRSDPGEPFIDLVLARYAELFTAPLPPPAQGEPVLTLFSFPDGPHTCEIAAGKKVDGWTARPASAPAKSQTWATGSAFTADVIVEITNPAGTFPQGRYFHAANGFYAGLYIPTPQVTDAGPVPPPPPPITQEDVDAAAKQAAAAVANAAAAKAAEF